MKKLALHWQILIAILLAGLAGWLSGTEAGIGPLRFHAVYGFLGTIFIKALKMIIVPPMANQPFQLGRNRRVADSSRCSHRNHIQSLTN